MNSTRAGSTGVALAGIVAVGVLAGCTSGQSTGVPSLAGGSQAASNRSSQAQALHAAAQCIRDHGVRDYQDPVVDPNGNVYTDQRSLRNATGQAATNDNASGLLHQIMVACQSLISAANFNPTNEPRATPALVATGVAAARCMRAHGLPNYRDPTATTLFTPGHGFGLAADELPPGGKTSGVTQQAFAACRQQIDAELSASSLTNLGHG